MKYKKILAVFLTLLTVLTVFSLSASALSWDGSSAGGSTNAVNGSSTGYVIRSTNDSNCVVGYRFSVVNSSGGMKVNKVIDVFRNTGNGDNAYSSSAKFTTKYNKKQLIANKNAKLTTSQNTTNCYKESSMSFVSALPNPSGVETWQAYEGNINKVLTKIGVGTVSNMVYGDKVIIEPLFDICLAGEYQALTVTEIAYCGRSVKGGSSDGGTSNATSSTWGFISNYTNRIWPNKLYTPDGQGLWTAASAIGSSAKATFDNILTKGYGAGIAYNETANITYTIKFNGNGSTSGSTASMSMVKDVAKNLTANGFAKTGYTFKSWNKKADGSSTSYTNKQSVKNLSSTQGATVNLYAQWTPITYTVKYNGNGSTGGSTTSSTHTYDKAKALTANGFTKTGHTFSGWNTKANGSGTSYTNKQSVKNLTSTSGATINLYAQWTPNKYTVSYNANGGSGAPGNQTKTYGVDLTLSSTKPTRTGYTFSKWNTKADGSGTNYNSGTKYTGNANLTLYAVWTPIKYTVSYNANGGSGAPGNQSKTYGVDLTLSSTKPIRTGYTFSKWNTKADSTGTNYNSGAKYTSNANLTLYAVWTPNKYTVTYNANGGSGAPGNQTKTYGVDLTLSSTKPTRTGYKFNGWNTNSSGTGTNYASGSKYTANANLTLYAKWTPNVLTLCYDCYGSNVTINTSTGYSLGDYNRILSTTKKNKTIAGTDNVFYHTLNYNNEIGGNGLYNFSTFGLTAPTGYSFSHWKNGTKTFSQSTNTYKPTDFTDAIANGDTYVWLTAQFTPITYTVKYYLDGIEQTSLRQTCTYGVSYKYPSIPTQTGQTVTGWWSGSSDSNKGTQYSAGSSFSNLTATNGDTVNRYAYSTPVTYTVNYNANGGNGAPSSQTKTYGVDLTLSSTKPTRTGYTFNGWNTKADATGTNYASGGKYISNANVTLYAKWIPITYTVKYNGNGNTGGTTASSSHTYDVSKALTANNFTKTGYIFKAWNTKADGSGTSYVDKQSVKNLTTVNGAMINLYAQWTPITYTIKFNGNGSTGGSTASMTMTYDAQKALTANGFTRSGYSFACWSIEKDGQGACYADKQLVKNMATENGAVITLYAQWNPERVLSIEAITPNAPYREKTEVITSFNLINNGNIDCIPNDNVSVKFKVYKDSNVIKTVTLNRVIVPKNDKNLLYFKWTVPENIDSSTIYVSGEIVENGSSYGLVKKAYETTKYVISATPDTQYAISAPSGFTVPNVPAEKNNTSTWTEWTYTDGSFRKVNYGIGFTLQGAVITPDSSANAVKTNGVWKMKSGYGFGISVPNGVRTSDGYTVPSASAYTLPQYTTAQFPEFSYLTTLNNFRTLELASSNWIFRDNADYGKIHFTPLWYPDGSYTVSVTQSDMWTPAGMITRKVNTNSIIIKGSAYDDWYI